MRVCPMSVSPGGSSPFAHKTTPSPPWGPTPANQSSQTTAQRCHSRHNTDNFPCSWDLNFEVQGVHALKPQYPQMLLLCIEHSFVPFWAVNVCLFSQENRWNSNFSGQQQEEEDWLKSDIWKKTTELYDQFSFIETGVQEAHVLYGRLFSLLGSTSYKLTRSF